MLAGTEDEAGGIGVEDGRSLEGRAGLAFNRDVRAPAGWSRLERLCVGVSLGSQHARSRIGQVHQSRFISQGCKGLSSSSIILAPSHASTLSRPRPSPSLPRSLRCLAPTPPTTPAAIQLRHPPAPSLLNGTAETRSTGPAAAPSPQPCKTSSLSRSIWPTASEPRWGGGVPRVSRLAPPAPSRQPSRKAARAALSSNQPCVLCCNSRPDGGPSDASRVSSLQRLPADDSRSHATTPVQPRDPADAAVYTPRRTPPPHPLSVERLIRRPVLLSTSCGWPRVPSAPREVDSRFERFPKIE